MIIYRNFYHSLSSPLYSLPNLGKFNRPIYVPKQV
nr:MAG TPA: hypothetical protein [Bacteriophage sp.]